MNSISKAGVSGNALTHSELVDSFNFDSHPGVALDLINTSGPAMVANDLSVTTDPAPPPPQTIKLTDYDDSFATDAKGSITVKLLGGDDYGSGYGAGNYKFLGGDGNDYLSHWGPGNAELYGNAGNNMLVAGGSGLTHMYGGADTDRFIWYGGDGEVDMKGGGGADTYDLYTGGNVSITELQKGEHIDVWNAGGTAFIQDSDHSFIEVGPNGAVGHVTMSGHHLHMFTDGTVNIHLGDMYGGGIG